MESKAKAATENDQKNAENVYSSELDCPICMNIMVEPVTLPCKHTFCYVCLK